jgi:hypothetical protein
MSDGGVDEARSGGRPDPEEAPGAPAAVAGRERLNSRQQVGQRHSSTRDPSGRL